jgi:glycerol uptake facilitator protein
MEKSAFLGELIGTATLIFLGCGVNANNTLKKTYAQGSGWMVITTGWAFAVIFGIFVANYLGSSDAHLNPAVTICFAIVTDDFSKILPYISAQMIGAIVGATLVWLQYKPHWKDTEAPAQLGCFATSSAISNTKTNFIGELLATAMLLIGIQAISAKGDLAGGFAPYLVGLLVWSVGLSLGGSTGYAINPARDLGPRIAYAILPIENKGTANWGYAWLPVVADSVGAIVAALFIKMF